MKILFWNTNRNKDINGYVSSLISNNSIDILALAEYTADINELLRMSCSQGVRLMEYTTIGCERIKFFGNYKNVEPATQDKYYSIQIIDEQYIICGVHLPSDLYGDKTNERYMISRRIIYDVQEEEKKLLNPKTIIMGDFNEMPYCSSCLNADAFHALPVFEESRQAYRAVLGSVFKKYYNPMWNFLGDFSYPPGTYYRNEATIASPMWFLLDQFVFGWETVPLIHREQLRIITECKYGKLFDINGHPNKRISDHFPIMCEINDDKQN